MFNEGTRALVAAILAACVAGCDGVGHPILTSAMTTRAGTGTGTSTGTATTASSPQTDTSSAELDRDADGVAANSDCNDFNQSVFPGAVEIFDGFDNDCNGEINEGNPQETGFPGYGWATVGGSGAGVITVTSLEDAGVGTLREAVENASGPRMVVFAVAGEIRLQTPIVVTSGFLTINGASAAAPGITVVPPPATSGLVIEQVRDVIVTHLRFTENPNSVSDGPGHYAVEIDGEAGQGETARLIVFDHLTFEGTKKSAVNVWGSSADVTLSYNLFHGCVDALTLSGPNTRDGVSLFANAFLANSERMPQVVGSSTLEMVGNVLFDWGAGEGTYGFGMRVAASSGFVDANIVGNAFLATSNANNAIFYGAVPGPDLEDGAPMAAPQGEVVEGTGLGALWVEGNLIPISATDQYSTVTSANMTPDGARVVAWPVQDLGESTLPWAGVRYRLESEQQLADAADLVLTAG